LPTLSRLSVSHRPEGRLRRWYSSRYLRISPLHRKFCLPLRDSSEAVSDAIPGLGPGLSQPTCQAAYTRFTPNDSEQRLHPPYYSGCWHGVSRCFLWRYRQAPVLFERQPFSPPDRGLRPEGLHPSRGVAGSGFRPLPKIPDCCLPQESGPCLSSSVADHPLRPATHQSLGEPSPHQLANGTRAHRRAIASKERPSFSASAEELVVLSSISPSFPGLS